MIKWKSNFGHSIEMVFLGYEYPEITEDYDANWVKIKINAKNERASWSKTSACMFSWDIYRLSKWLNAVIIGEINYDSFIALDMDFEIQYIATSLKEHVFAVIQRYR